jgi:hypothetical protein
MNYLLSGLLEAAVSGRVPPDKDGVIFEACIVSLEPRPRTDLGRPFPSRRDFSGFTSTIQRLPKIVIHRVTDTQLALRRWLSVISIMPDQISLWLILTGLSASSLRRVWRSSCLIYLVSESGESWIMLFEVADILTRPKKQIMQPLV